ncbi:ADP-RIBOSYLATION FACTOR GTPASE-ACTIVATING PROTEIN AGD5 [Salix koriyanagi]|uniref:ADP-RIBOSYLATION FACTOR GTPASE-ACTIVATING PROTEIN AGD5 n=1 Tax=Salix koriyanagi TaxID=2511006 RepID=A0A9Q0UY04_9ROSI|nr:ADP-RIBOSYLATION FACTOR GTPASE-ACTIVATING PROTEIN AGD5 [Salix koriyanagi]
MNEKANVSKELNANHRKILESLLKLPESRECADCKSKGPRWASVNLGIFICMQCLGAHRSLGVHISKVRSATLDTWLPEQIAFIQSMGNERSNNYWEAELPPNYDRVGIECFIRAKYEEKRWVPRDGKAKSLSRVNGEKIPTRSGGHGRMNDTNHVFEERKITCPPVTKNSTPLPVKASTPLPVKASSPLLAKVSTPMAVKVSTPMVVKASQKVAHHNKSQELMQKSEPAAPKAELSKKEENATKNLTLPKVDYATELFNLLCMDDSRESDSTIPAHDKNGPISKVSFCS